MDESSAAYNISLNLKKCTPNVKKKYPIINRNENSQPQNIMLWLGKLFS